MHIKDMELKQIPLQESFSYKNLFNDSRGAVHKDDNKSLISWCIEDGVIKVEKYLIVENIARDTVWGITDSKDKSINMLKEYLKDYPQESDYDLFPFVYLLGRICPNYKVNLNRADSEQPVFDYPTNIEVGYRFNGTNAFIRIYLVDEKVAINSSNDSVENLVDTLLIKDNNTVYIVDVEGVLTKNKAIVAYKIMCDTDTFVSREEQFREHFRKKISEYLK